MKLVDVCEFFSDSGGGVCTYVEQKLEYGAREGWDITIIAPGAEDRREKRLGGEVIWVKSPVLRPDPRYHLFKHAEPVHGLLDEISPHVLEGSSTWRGGWIAGSWPTKKSQPKYYNRPYAALPQHPVTKSLFLHQDPVAVYPHTLFSPPFSEERVDQLCFWFWWYLRRLSKNFDVTAVSGEWFAKRLERFGVKRPITSSFGIDKYQFSPRRRSEFLRQKMLAACGIDNPDAPLFVAVSRHHMEKRLDTMMSAFERFSQDQPAGLFLIGDGPARRKVEKRAQQINGIYVAGHIDDRDDLADYLASADYMLHGGAAETFGLVVAEAVCSGLPLIVPDIGGAADLAHPTYAQTYRPGNVEALLDAMKMMVSRDINEVRIAARAATNRLCTPEEHFRSLFSQYVNVHDIPVEQQVIEMPHILKATNDI